MNVDPKSNFANSISILTTAVAPHDQDRIKGTSESNIHKTSPGQLSWTLTQNSKMIVGSTSIGGLEMGGQEKGCFFGGISGPNLAVASVKALRLVTSMGLFLHTGFRFGLFVFMFCFPAFTPP